LYRTKTNIQTANDYGNDTNLNTISCNFLNNNNLSHTNNNNNNQSQNQNNNNNIQWNLWQQFQWPYVQPEQNRWSKSILLAHEFFFLFVFCSFEFEKLFFCFFFDLCHVCSVISFFFYAKCIFTFAALYFVPL
jgi:hypothetical protein